MRRFSVFLLALISVALPVVGQTPIDYRFDRVRSKVTVSTPAEQIRASEGTIAHSGDRVRAGWFGYAMLTAPRYAAHFEVFAGSDVRLAGGTAGVLLTLDRGRIEAIFDAVTGQEPRMVQTPGALLAVRGTRYGVEVGRGGIADLVVFEGVVEVRSPLRPEPLLVRAGETCHFGTNTPPKAMPMPRGMTEEMWRKHGAGGDGMMPRDGGMDGRSRPQGAPPHPPMSGSGRHG